MAKKRFFRAKAKSSFGKRVKRYGSKVGSNPTSIILPAMIYGAGRKYLSDMASPITTKVAGVAGNYADELVFGLAGWYIAKKNLFGMKKVGMAMLTVEAASVGSQLAGQFGMPSASKPKPTAWE